MITIQMVEALRHVARHLDVLDLVAADRHLVRLEHQNIGAHQHWIHKQAGGDIGVRVGAGGGVFIQRRLVRVCAVEHALAGHAGEQPRQLGNLGNVGLAVERDARRVQPGSQPACRDFQRRLLDARRVVAFDQRVVVGQEVKALHAGQAAGGY
jgi:hypothetical protein